MALAADTLVAEGLAFLGDRPDDLIRFFDLTGLTPAALRAAAATPEFAESLLDFLCSDDRLLQTFADWAGHDPAAIDAARQRLRPPGGDHP